MGWNPNPFMRCCNMSKSFYKNIKKSIAKETSVWYIIENEKIYKKNGKKWKNMI